jgi:hypothetical protein
MKFPQAVEKNTPKSVLPGTQKRTSRHTKAYFPAQKSVLPGTLGGRNKEAEMLHRCSNMVSSDNRPLQRGPRLEKPVLGLQELSKRLHTAFVALG